MDFKASQVGMPTFSTQAQGAETPSAPHNTHHTRLKKAGAEHASSAVTVEPATQNPEVTAAHVWHAMSWQGMAGIIVVLLLLIYGLYKIVRFIAGLFTGKNSSGMAEADYSIPHCNHTKTDDGFIVKFTRQPVWLDNIDPANRPLLLAFIFVVPFLIGLPLFILKSIFKPTRIEVTREAVLVDGKKYNRADFGPFFVSRTKNIHRDLKNQYSIIAYNYGRKKTEMSYLWKESEALEFLNALNHDIRSVPLAGDQHQPSPDQLRQAARPADF